MFRKPLLLLASLVAATACSPLSARPLVRMDVVDRDTGQWLPEYHHRGDHWIAGRPGHRYAVRLTNTTGERVLVVLSVDGVNAVTGETAHPAQAGYVLAPWQSTEIDGWRKSLDDVAQFVFTDLPDSYAARTGRPDNVGTIGIAVFRERTFYPPPSPIGPPIARQDSAGNASRAHAPAAQATQSESAAADSAYGGGVARQRIGTGHGARQWAPVARTGFERASRSPAQVIQLRYDDVDTLAARGILPQPYRYGHRHEGPRAFPGGFVTDPPGW
ncbi:hypothetical protein [Luteimonas vadosa]|uniref:Uncharacterized protein n=1 Tax=Luteimonas vadosa TaxID=1165507 RepID=A0ABP9DQN6_9GAMM